MSFHVPAHKNVEHPAGQVTLGEAVVLFDTPGNREYLREPADPVEQHFTQHRAIAAPRKPHDFELADHGSVCILFALTPAASEWVEDNLPADRATWGINGSAIEARCVGPILQGIIDSGLAFSA